MNIIQMTMPSFQAYREYEKQHTILSPFSVNFQNLYFILYDLKIFFLRFSDLILALNLYVLPDFFTQ